MKSYFLFLFVLISLIKVHGEEGSRADHIGPYAQDKIAANLEKTAAFLGLQFPPNTPTVSIPTEPLKPLKVDLAAGRPYAAAVVGAGRSSPACRMHPDYEYTFQGNAGCFIKTQNRLLVARHKSPWNPAQDKALKPPGGMPDHGESAQCTAYRETFEEAGVNVTVGELLHVFGNKFFLFHCRLDPQDRVRTTFDVPDAALEEVYEILLIDPATMVNETTGRIERWRFPSDGPVMRKLFLSLPQQPS